MSGKSGHDEHVEEMLEKARGLGKTDGYEWVIRTKYRLLDNNEKEEILEAGKADDALIRIGVFKTEPARVVAQKGLTINLGGYESARITVGFECPCYAEEMKEIEEVLNARIEKRIQSEVIEIRGKDIRPGFEAKRPREEAEAIPSK